MQKLLTDMHTHSTFSHDGRDDLKTMLNCAVQKGIVFYGVSEHFDFDYDYSKMPQELRAKLYNTDEEEYFHAARHIQEAYEGVINVAIGAEFGYSDDEKVQGRYVSTYEKYRPDFVINSVHGVGGVDFAYAVITGDKTTVYKSYLQLVRRSLDAPYPYDIVGHIGYVARYVPFEDRAFSLGEFGEELDDILKTIVQKGKILEVNSSNKNLETRTIPCKEIIQRYYELGGRKVSFGSDAHFQERILEKRDEVVEMLQEIGFTEITVPFRGEHIKIPL